MMPKEFLNRHIWRCRLIKQGLNPDRISLLPSSAPAYTNATGVVSFLSGHGEHATLTSSHEKRTTVLPTLALVAELEHDHMRLMGIDQTRMVRTSSDHRLWASSWEVTL